MKVEMFEYDDCNTQTQFYRICCALKNCVMSSFSKVKQTASILKNL